MGIKDCAESPRCILVEAKEQETAWVLRWKTLLDEVPTKLHQVLQLSECWLLLSLLRAVVCKMGSFLLMRPLGTLIQVPRENFKVRGSCPEKKKPQKKEVSLCPKDCGTNSIDSEKFLAQLRIQDVPSVSTVPY